MTSRTLTTALLGALVALYPLAIYFGLNYLDPRWLALAVLVVVGFRLIGGQIPRAMALGFAAALLTACGLTLITGAELGLLLYPVLVNLTLLVLFALSLRHPPSIIETLARLREPDLPPQGVVYTRKVTLVWAIFFAVNGTIAAATIVLGKTWWTLYNGLIAYLLMGLLFAVEWLVRQRVMRRAH